MDPAREVVRQPDGSRTRRPLPERGGVRVRAGAPAVGALALSLLVTLTPALAGAAEGSSAPSADARPGAAGGELLTQEEVVDRALARSAGVQAARSRALAAGAQEKSLRGRLLPSVTLSDELQRWDSAFVVPFPAPLGPVSARDQTTNAFTASAGQPLLGLLHLGEDLAARGRSARAAEADLRTTQAAVKETVLVQLVQLFEARALAEIGQASVTQLAEQLEVARARLAAGAGTRADELRLATAVANARQSVIQARADEEAQRAALLVAVGEPADEGSLDFAGPDLPEPGAAPDLPGALRIAQQRRPELEAARLLAEAAEKRARARTFELLPEVNAEAAYLHVTGQSFQPEDSSFVGIKAEWPIWDWGARWFARSAAAAEADAAAAQRGDAADRVAVEVAGRVAAARASASAVSTARTAIASAEEAYRVTDALVKAGSATTTDLLDAQSALTTARQNLARARYAHARTRVNLARATGEL